MRRFLLANALLFVMSSALAQENPAAVDWASRTPAPKYPSHQALPGAAASEPGKEAAPAAADFAPLPDAVDAKTITEGDLGQTRVVVGTIVEAVPSRNERMPTILVLNEAPRFSVIYYGPVGQVAEAGKGTPKAGQKVTARGVISKYREDLQLEPLASGDLFLEGTGRAPGASEGGNAATAKMLETLRASDEVTSISLLSEKTGKNVIVAGVVDNFRKSSAERTPSILTIQDGSGSVQVVYWENTTMGIDPKALQPGAAVLAAGEAGLYRERMQIRLRDKNALRVVSPDRPEADQIKAVKTEE